MRGHLFGDGGDELHLRAAVLATHEQLAASQAVAQLDQHEWEPAKLVYLNRRQLLPRPIHARMRGSVPPAPFRHSAQPPELHTKHVQHLACMPAFALTLGRANTQHCSENASVLFWTLQQLMPCSSGGYFHGHFRGVELACRGIAAS